MAFDLLLDIDFVDGEVVVDRVRVAGLAVEEAGFEVEGVGQAVRRIDAHDQGAVARAGELQAGGGGETGFPDASFAAEEKDAHTSILARTAAIPIRRRNAIQDAVPAPHFGCPGSPNVKIRVSTAEGIHGSKAAPQGGSGGCRRRQGRRNDIRLWSSR